MKSQNYGTAICAECNTRISIDDAEASYNAELDDVIFICTKCIYDPAYSSINQETEDDIENDCS